MRETPTRPCGRAPAPGWGLPLILAALALPLLPAPSAAQIWRSQEGRYRAPMRDGLPEKRGGFVFCRLWYDAVRSMPSGLGWSTDYPAADANFVTRLEELTPIHVSHWKDGDPGIAAMRATDPDIFQCPFLFMTDPGSVRFSPEEIQALREYLMKGGFLWADDLWGEQAWRYFEEEISHVLPELPIVEIEPGHPLLSSYYMIDKIPQIPSIQSWRRSGGRTSEFGAETAVPHIKAIFDHDGRLLVVISHNTDIADGWEREGDEPDFFFNFSPQAYGVAINILYWAMSR